MDKFFDYDLLLNNNDYDMFADLLLNNDAVRTLLPEHGNVKYHGCKVGSAIFLPLVFSQLPGAFNTVAGGRLVGIA
jgi:hypothetical protein